MCVYARVGPAIRFIIFLCLVAMIHLANQVNATHTHTNIYIYVSTLGYLELFVCVFVVCE